MIRKKLWGDMNKIVVKTAPVSNRLLLIPITVVQYVSGIHCSHSHRCDHASFVNHPTININMLFLDISFFYFLHGNKTNYITKNCMFRQISVFEGYFCTYVPIHEINITNIHENSKNINKYII